MQFKTDAYRFHSLKLLNYRNHAGIIVRLCFCIRQTRQVPLSVIVAWIAGIQMDLDFKLIETGSLFVSVIVTAFTLQVHTHTHTTYSPFSSLMNIQANHFTAFAGWFVTLPQGDPSAAVLHCDRCMLLCYEATCKYVGSFHRTDWDLHSLSSVVLIFAGLCHSRPSFL